MWYVICFVSGFAAGWFSLLAVLLNAASKHNYLRDAWNARYKGYPKEK